MHINQRKVSALRAVRCGVLILLLCAAMTGAWAKPHKPNPSQAVLVVAHVPFGGKSLKDMSMQTQSNGARYLYVEHSSEQGVSIVDISEPTRPTLAGSIAWPDSGTTHIRDVTGEAVLVSEAATSSTANQPASDPLVLWDTSRPNHPKVVQRFAQVIRVLSDDRGYVYLLNADGLWVISTPTAYEQNQPDAFHDFWSWLASFGG